MVGASTIFLGEASVAIIRLRGVCGMYLSFACEVHCLSKDGVEGACVCRDGAIGNDVVSLTRWRWTMRTRRGVCAVLLAIVSFIVDKGTTFVLNGRNL